MNFKNHSTTGLEIAIIGMSGRFPGAKNLDGFWNNLQNGVESIVSVTDEELRASGIGDDMLNDPNYIKAGGFLDDIEYFDASFFDYTSNEITMMDPQIRIFHECVWEALEDAGYDSQRYKGSIGLYAGAAPNTYWENLSLLSKEDMLKEYFIISLYNNRDFMSTRISYKLNLKGPSMTVSTACSTSLVAIHLACQSLLSGECNMAVAGGVAVYLPKKQGYFYQDGLIFSPNGHCRAFDAKAQGTILTSGVGAIVLKPLEDAIADGDHIRAVIKGSAINNDGHLKVGYAAPSPKGQAMVIRAAQQAAQVEAESISYVETHGTGTLLGDPIEIEALTLAFNTDKKQFCRIGSLKPNVGHMYVVAGVASVIKAVLALENKKIPPSINFEVPNPKIDFDNSPFYVNTQLAEWKNESYPLRAGVSSFGIGGTNAHAILEQAPEIEKPGQERAWKIVVFSAKTHTALNRATENLTEFFRKNPQTSLADAAYTLQIGRRPFEYRRMSVCSDNRDLLSSLSPIDPKKVVTSFTDHQNKDIVFMFPGQGSEYIRMGLELYEKEIGFREEIDKCFAILKPIFGYDLKEILYPSPSNETSKGEKLYQTDIAQTLLFSFEYALAKLLIKWGIRPWALIGHSIGEYTAACIANVISLEDALRLVASRGRLIEGNSSGAMLSIPLPEKELQALLPDELSVTAVNSSSRCVVSGSHKAIDAFEGQMKKQGYDTKRLHTSHSFHPATLDPILKEFGKIVQGIPLNTPAIPYISNVTGKWISDDEIGSPTYWIKHLRETIRFSDGLQELFKQPNAIFIEVGPGSILSSFALQHKDKESHHTILNLVKHPKEKTSDIYYLFNKIGLLWTLGVEMDWHEFHAGKHRTRVSLPSYPFERERFDFGIIDWKAFRVDGIEQPVVIETHKTDSLDSRKDFPETYIAPQDQVKKTVIEVFQEFLGRDKISTHENFFELGGDSLNIPKILNKLYDKLHVEVTFEEFFTNSSIDALEQKIMERKKRR